MSGTGRSEGPGTRPSAEGPNPGRQPATLSPPFTAGDGRKFGFTVGAAFLLLAGFLWWRGHAGWACAPAAAGGLLILGGALLPGRLGPVHHGWMALAQAISRVTTPIVMGLLYFIVITPSGLVRRAVGGSALVREPEGGSGDSYWVRREERRSDLLRQF